MYAAIGQFIELEDRLMTQPKDDCETLMNSLMPFAEKLLSKHQEFSPYGGTMDNQGEIQQHVGWLGEDPPESEEIIQLLKIGFHTGAKRGDFKATALIYDVHVAPPDEDQKQDAIAINLDHRDAYSIVVVFPYAFDSKGKLVLEEPFSVKGDEAIFTG